MLVHKIFDTSHLGRNGERFKKQKNPERRTNTIKAALKKTFLIVSFVLFNTANYLQ